MLEDSNTRQVLNFDSYLSEFGTNLLVNPFYNLLAQKTDPKNINLSGGLPNSNLFPITELSFKVDVPSSSSYTISRTPETDSKSGISLDKAQQYTNGLGNPALVKYLKTHVTSHHKPKYSEYDVMLTVGNSDSLFKTIKLVMDPGQVILVERWAYPTAMETFKAFKLNVVAVDIDEEGLIPESMVEVIELWNSKFASNKVKAVYTVPTGQNPTGATMGLERRHKIYSICQQYDLIVIEDDPYYYLQLPQSISPPLQPHPTDQELVHHFGFNSLLPSLLSLDTDGRVIRLDSFAKTLAPGLRIGFLTAHHHFCKKYKILNEISTLFPSGYTQAVLVKLFVDGWTENQFEILLARLSYELYTRIERLAKILDAANNLTNVIHFKRPGAGMFIWLAPTLNTNSKIDDDDGDQLFDKLIENKVLVVPANYFDSQVYTTNKVIHFKTYQAFRFSFGFEDFDAVIEGLQRLLNTLKSQN